MLPVKSWAIGCFHEGECIGLVRYLYNNGRPGEPILYRSRAAARLDIEDPCFERLIPNNSRPVRVRVELERRK